MDGGQTLLNNKLEFSRCVLPELETVMKDRIVSRKIAEETKEEIKQIELEACPEIIKMDKKRGKNDDKHEDQPNKKRRRLEVKPKEKMKKIMNYFPAEDNRKADVGQELDGNKVDRFDKMMSTTSNNFDNHNNPNVISQVLSLVEQEDGTGQTKLEIKHEALENVKGDKADPIEEVQSQSSTSQHPPNMERVLTTEKEVDTTLALEQTEMDMKDGKKVGKVTKYNENLVNTKINATIFIQVLGLVEQENGTETETCANADVKIEPIEGVQSQDSTSQHLGLEEEKLVENEEKLNDGRVSNSQNHNPINSIAQTNPKHIQEQDQAALDRTGPEKDGPPEADLEGEVEPQEAKNHKVQSQSQEAARYKGNNIFKSNPIKNELENETNQFETDQTPSKSTTHRLPSLTSFHTSCSPLNHWVPNINRQVLSKRLREREDDDPCQESPTRRTRTSPKLMADSPNRPKKETKSEEECQSSPQRLKVPIGISVSIPGQVPDLRETAPKVRRTILGPSLSKQMSPRKENMDRPGLDALPNPVNGKSAGKSVGNKCGSQPEGGKSAGNMLSKHGPNKITSYFGPTSRTRDVVADLGPHPEAKERILGLPRPKIAQGTEGNDLEDKPNVQSMKIEDKKKPGDEARKQSTNDDKSHTLGEMFEDLDNPKMTRSCNEVNEAVVDKKTDKQSQVGTDKKRKNCRIKKDLLSKLSDYRKRKIQEEGSSLSSTTKTRTAYPEVKSGNPPKSLVLRQQKLNTFCIPRGENSTKNRAPDSGL